MKPWHILIGTASFLGSFTQTSQIGGQEPDPSVALTTALSELSPRVLSETSQKKAASMVERDIRKRRDAANARNRAEWSAISNRQEWEDFRDQRLERLQKSLGTFPTPPKTLNQRTARTLEGDGFRIENVVYESRPGDWVSGNLYVPAVSSDSMPGIIIAHAHHRPKHQGELQDMGMTWARAGCTVLVIDQVGYGERRAHPFDGPDDYSQPYRWSRQDYYYRYDSGIQLQLVGESLMGWMAWDLMRGVDLLLARDRIDPQRIILLGAVAGGGDPCGITAALDARIAAAVPFNFGGPQPETRYPLPADAESSFNYVMGSYWESTRGLRRTAADGFFHWVIVGGIAPRRLIYAHEFSWDKMRDPIWKRYQKIYGEFYGVPNHLAAAHGQGTLHGRASEASHCTNIGRVHRAMIHPVFQRWFQIDVKVDDEYRARRDISELACFTKEFKSERKPPGFVNRVARIGETQANKARRQIAVMKLAERRQWLRHNWSRLLGDIQRKMVPQVRLSTLDKSIAGVTVERIELQVESDIVLPMLIIYGTKSGKPSSTVVAVAQSGKASFLRQRSDQIVELVRGGAIICLPDVRATGETKAGTSRGRTSGDGNRSVNLLMFDQTMLGQRLRDLQSVVVYLRGRADVDAQSISLWGDSFAPVNGKNTNFKVPRGVNGRPQQPEPLGGLLALLGALFDENIARVYVHGGLSSYQSVLGSHDVYIPHDAVVPGILTTGDLCDVAAALAPRPLRLDGLVNALNRRLSVDQMRMVYKPTIDSYRQAGAEQQIFTGSASSATDWLLMSR